MCRNPSPHDEHERDSRAWPTPSALALLVVLETLAPAERLAFVLHDMFAVPFEEIAPIVGRTPAAARQLASRARRRVQGTPAAPRCRSQPAAADRRRLPRGLARRRLRGTARGARSRRRVPRRSGRACGWARWRRSAARQPWPRPSRAARRARKPALVDGTMALAVVLGGQLRIVLRLTITGDRISAVEAVADAERIGGYAMWNGACSAGCSTKRLRPDRLAGRAYRR